MKDEELAENWIAEYTSVDVKTQKAIQLQYHKNLKQVFLAGLSVGRSQWHDLQKDPNDLPEDKRNVWCDYGDGCGKGHYNKDDGGWWIESHMFCSVIDTWCELPTFHKE